MLYVKLYENTDYLIFTVQLDFTTFKYFTLQLNKNYSSYVPYCFNMTLKNWHRYQIICMKVSLDGERFCNTYISINFQLTNKKHFIVKGCKWFNHRWFVSGFFFLIMHHFLISITVLQKFCLQCSWHKFTYKC